MREVRREQEIVVSGQLRGNAGSLFLTDRGSGMIYLEPLENAQRFNDEATARQWISVYLQTAQARNLEPGTLKVCLLTIETVIEPL